MLKDSQDSPVAVSQPLYALRVHPREARAVLGCVSSKAAWTSQPDIQLSVSVLLELAERCTGEATCMNMENSECVPWLLEYVASLRLGCSGGHEPGRQLSARNRHGAAIPSGDENITTLRTEINDDYTRKLVYPVVVLTSHNHYHMMTH